MSSSDATAYDPRPLRVAVVVAVLFLAGPGSVLGASFLWTLGGGAPFVPLAPAPVHAMLQLAGGFMTFIWSFLALGVPHLLGLDLVKARRIIVAIVVVALGLALEVAGVSAVVARGVGLAGALLGVAVLVRARLAGRGGSLQKPGPFLVVALALYPLAWALYVLELLPRARVPAGVAGETVLFLVVVPVVMSMGWKMFSAMLQLDAGHAPRFTIAVVCWLAGGALVVLARWGASTFSWLPAALDARTLQLVAAPLLFVGAALWFASLHGLRRRRGGLALQVTAGPELRAHVVVGALSLLASPLLFLAAALTRAPALADVARHVLAIGFVLAVTMGVTLRALPRFCKGRPSSTPLALVSLTLLVAGLALRAARLAPEGGALVRASAVVTLAAVVVWGAHLLRGVWPVREPAAT